MIEEFQNSDYWKSQASIAWQLATEIHSGQYRRDKVTPYINHINDVKSRTWAFYRNYFLMAIAILHDSIEDGENINSEYLSDNGIDKRIVDVVMILTHSNDDSYEEYIAKIIENKYARLVKIADIISNLADCPTEKQVKKYAPVLALLAPFFKIENTKS